MIEAISTWANELGAQYGVNPGIFASIYVGAIPLFLASIAWLVRNARAGRADAAAGDVRRRVLRLGLCLSRDCRQDIPLWVWFFLGALILYGIWSTVRACRQSLSPIIHVGVRDLHT